MYTGHFTNYHLYSKIACIVSDSKHPSSAFERLSWKDILDLEPGIRLYWDFNELNFNGYCSTYSSFEIILLTV